MTFGPSNTLGPYLPINQTFSEDEDQRLIQMTNRDRDIARYLNIRQIGIYDLNENPTGQQFPGTTPQSKKQTFRKIFELGPFAAGTVNTIAHGISGITSFTQIYGTALTTTASGGGFLSIPLPYVNITAITACIGLEADPTNIYIALGAIGHSISTCIIVLEYLKN